MSKQKPGCTSRREKLAFSRPNKKRINALFSPRSCIGFSAILVLSLTSALMQPEKAHSWSLRDLDPTDKNSGLRKGLRDIDPANPNSNMGRDLHAKIELCNNSSNTIVYTMDGNFRNLARGMCTTWTVMGHGWLRFDKSYASGYQEQVYRLNDGRYTFVDVTWPQAYGPVPGIDIRRE